MPFENLRKSRLQAEAATAQLQQQNEQRRIAEAQQKYDELSRNSAVIVELFSKHRKEIYSLILSLAEALFGENAQGKLSVSSYGTFHHFDERNDGSYQTQQPKADYLQLVQIINAIRTKDKSKLDSLLLSRKNASFLPFYGKKYEYFFESIRFVMDRGSFVSYAAGEGYSSAIKISIEITPEGIKIGDALFKDYDEASFEAALCQEELKAQEALRG